MKKNTSEKKRTKRVLRTPVPVTLLNKVKEKMTGYGNGEAFAQKSNIPYQSLYVIKNTGRATQKDIEKIRKVLKAA